MSNKLSLLRKILGKNKTDNVDASKLLTKDEKYFQITFDNHENPERSFTFDVKNPQNIYYTGKSDEKNSPFDEEVVTEVILEPKRRRKKAQNNNDSNNKQSFVEDSNNSIVLSQPRVFTWKNKDAYVYKVESKYNNDGERPDLEFVIYIPIDTAVKWLNSRMETNPDYISVHSLSDKDVERGFIKYLEEERKYGTEEDESRKYTVLAWKNEDKSESLDSDEEDEEEEEDEKEKGGKKGPKANKVKEKKVRAPKKKTKKARRVITTYEVDEDEISLGRLRPEETPKKPVKILTAKDQLY